MSKNTAIDACIKARPAGLTLGDKLTLLMSGEVALCATTKIPFVV